MKIIYLECDVNAVELQSESGGCPVCVCKPGFAGPGNEYLNLLIVLYILKPADITAHFI